ncbi:unnamed protein product [Fusarium graminearum]|nr:unnamed protein product [Fusarium graminearum]CAG2003016.1 unnamed protein product [Fusarium graminearum]CAG2003674.1 unnamed protein product [Fusarium graminearum]VTO92387.1 unnamed protein product [Fusarium graminearum]
MSIVVAQCSAEFDEQDLRFEWSCGQAAPGMILVDLVGGNSVAQGMPSILSRQPRRSRNPSGARLPSVFVAEARAATKPKNLTWWVVSLFYDLLR